MSEETPQLPVSEQEVQIEAPSLLDKIKAQKKKILIGLSSFLGILILAGTVFGVYKLGQRQVSPVPQPIPTPIIETTPTLDQTADWQTYTNIKYGFSIRYPKNYTTQEYGPSGPASIQVQLESTEINIGIFWLSQSPAYDMSLTEWYNNLLTVEIPYTPYGAQTSPEYIERKEIEVGGVKGIQLKQMGEHVDFATILLPISNAVVEISVNYEVIETPETQQILSTFRFLEGENCIKTDTGESMALTEAKEIALKSECVGEGSLKETYSCNEYTGTWWLDLDIEKPGCAPACVVNVVTKEAEINWRCTGLLPE